MPLVRRLIELMSESLGTPVAEADGFGDATLAVAALLVHVARVDGSFAEAERQRLLDLLASRFRLSEDAAKALITRAASLDQEVDDITTLIGMLGREVDAEQRGRLLGMAYQIAGADGTVDEFEDDLIWRMGHLLGFDDREILARKDEALPAANRLAGSPS